MKHSLSISLAILFVTLAASTRFLDLPFNFSPIIAIALLCAFAFRGSAWGFALPIGAMLVSDLILNNTTYKEWFPDQSFVFITDHMVWTYGSIILIVLIGGLMLNKFSWSKVLSSSIVAAVVFFVVTNFGSWLSIDAYPKTLAGLWSCYVAGLPFFRATLASNVLFTCFFFGVYVMSIRLLSARFSSSS